MAADSSMGFHQGVTTSFYNHHMLSFQSGDVSSGGGAGMVMASRGMSGGSMGGFGSSSSAGLFLSPNTGVVGNMSVVGPSRSSSGDVFHGATSPKYKFVTGSPADWSLHELSILKEGLIRYAHEPNIMKYIKIAAMLPTRTIRDVALRCWWTTGKESSKRRKPDEFYTGKKIRDMKDKMVASTSVANIHMAPSNNVIPFSISMHHPSQHCRVPNEVPVLDSATQHLLEENNQLLNNIAANIEAFKMEENMDLFLRTNNNIKTILNRMTEMPGIMGQMPPLPVPVNEDHLNSLLQLDRMVLSYGAPSNSHMKQESRC